MQKTNLTEFNLIEFNKLFSFYWWEHTKQTPKSGFEDLKSR